MGDGFEDDFEWHSLLGGEGEAILGEHPDDDGRVLLRWEGLAIEVAILVLHEGGDYLVEVVFEFFVAFGFLMFFQFLRDLK